MKRWLILVSYGTFILVLAYVAPIVAIANILLFAWTYRQIGRGQHLTLAECRAVLRDVPPR